ncbi:MAG: methyltransferase domain-containing protein, partial [Chloroflexi bacterium]|nr:methyltransferase domain-containing protein [Chloroflexota bacterium]
GYPQRMQEMLDWLYPVRDRILGRIQLGDGETVLDVGCGDGLIAFGALDKFPTCRVIFSDISDDLLGHVRLLAQDMHVENRCQFVRASADKLSMLADESIAAVTTRSVLIYVSAKQQAFNEFYRVLKPGGRVSLFEPINRFAYPESPDCFDGYDVTPVVEIAQKLKAVYEQIQPPATDPMTDFDERDLIACAEKAGFTTVNLELHVEIKPPDNADWEVMIHTAGNPKIPTLAEAMQQTLTHSEVDAFVHHLRPLVEARQGVYRCAMAYLWATK